VRYLLDTNILSDLLRNPTGAVYRRLGEVPEDAAVTSIVVAAELRFGGQRAARPQLLAAIEGLLDRMAIVPFEMPADRTYAVLRAELERRGRPLASMVLLIAAHALALGCTLVSADAAFRRVPGLRVENWLNE
jgi:tRNA(fMet)-specific endonuclease VapC